MGATLEFPRGQLASVRRVAKRRVCDFVDAVQNLPVVGNTKQRTSGIPVPAIDTPCLLLCCFFVSLDDLVGQVGELFQIAPRAARRLFGDWGGAISLLLFPRPFRRFDDGIRSTDQP